MRSSTLIAFATAFAAPLVSAIPGGPMKLARGPGRTDKSLTEKRDIPDKEKVGYLIYSHGCVPSGSGFPHCTDMYTMKWGKEGEYKDCNDSPTSFEDSCTIADADNDIDTPMGKAFFTADVNECESGNRKGILLSKDVDNLFLYECEKEDYQFTENCGYTWASHALMKCSLDWA